MLSEVVIMKHDEAKDAKKHLKQMALIQNGDDTFFLNNRRLTVSEIARMRETISKSMSGNKFFNPIEKLLDKAEYASVSDDQKFRYLLELSAIFLKLKNSTKI